MSEPRILTDQETARRRSERAANNGPAIVTLCAEPGCPRAASHGPWCGDHRPKAEPRVAVAHDLTSNELAAIRQQVDSDAAVLFVVAMGWISRQQMARIGVDLPTLEASLAGIQGELGRAGTLR